jgi:hypothetical protein
LQASALRDALVQPFDVGAPDLDAQRYAAACRMLALALADHPSLVDLMLFPTSLGASPEEAPAPDKASAQTCHVLLGHGSSARH